MTNDYPYISSFKDRHGKVRWRFRRGGKTISLPGEPGGTDFDEAYGAAIAGKEIRRDRIARRSRIEAPMTLGAAWKILISRTPEWKALSATSKGNQTRIADNFLSSPIGDGGGTKYGDLAVREIERRHVKSILASMSDTPHAAGHVLRLLRKLFRVALDEEWIDADPTYKIKYRPEYTGWRAWTDAERKSYEKRWPVGTTPRLAYALALWTGQRRSDVVAIKWDDIDDGGIHIVQKKTGHALWVPIFAELKPVLDAAPKVATTILTNQQGMAFSEKAIGMRMLEWTGAAGIERGATMHGLRKTLGKILAESGATTRQIMGILGHEDIAHAELYTRAADQRKLAKAGMKAILETHG